MRKVNLAERLAEFTERWSPRIVGELNGQPVKLVKLEDEFVIVPRGIEHPQVAERPRRVGRSFKWQTR